MLETRLISFMPEVDWKSKVSCFFPKSSQVVLLKSGRLQVDLGSVWNQVGSDLHTKVTLTSEGGGSQISDLRRFVIHMAISIKFKWFERTDHLKKAAIFIMQTYLDWTRSDTFILVPIDRAFIIIIIVKTSVCICTQWLDGWTLCCHLAVADPGFPGGGMTR